MPYSNFWYSGLLTVAAYTAARLAVKWNDMIPKTDARDAWLRGIAMGAGAIWSAFYLSHMLQLAWYGLTQPWIDAPRPF